MRQRVRIVGWILIIGLSMTLGKGLPVSGAGSDPNGLKQLIEKTRQEILNKKKKEKSVLTNLSKQQQELNRLERNLDKVTDDLRKTQQKYTMSQRELDNLKANLNELEADCRSRRELINQRLLVTYKYGPQTYLEILFMARNFADFVTKFDLISLYIKNDLRLLRELEAAKHLVDLQHQAVQRKTTEVKGQYVKIAGLKEKVSNEQTQVEKKVKLTKEELAKIQNDRAKLEKALAEYEQTSREIETQIRKDQQGSQSALIGTGTMIWPVQARITSPFGWRYHPVLHRNIYHNGLDLAVSYGTPVKAADDGVVLVSGWQGGYGNFVAIDHGNGISTCYGHNSRLLVSVGERVVKGQKISLAGSTGLSTGPHCHFEVRKNGTPINPIPYLPR